MEAQSPSLWIGFIQNAIAVFLASSANTVSNLQRNFSRPRAVQPPGKHRILDPFPMPLPHFVRLAPALREYWENTTQARASLIVPAHEKIN
ncbi:hypothetical protein [Phormidium sp. CCY1219]|uniref:hypothetical protein n=1 Tax=Phormidium sp. CCY1219 TaxID=2886104 RepID=UPI002D1F29D7|nr:hypothetical protein [Phormidium sp. CCY1219]MEB3828160.1 hypothetical protein [Phormidium sp. CCY1219]